MRNHRRSGAVVVVVGTVAKVGEVPMPRGGGNVVVGALSVVDVTGGGATGA
jgi:hypothetical protein